MQPAVSGGGFLRLIPPNFGTSAYSSIWEQTAWCVGGRGVTPLGYAPSDIAPKAASPSSAAKATGSATLGHHAVVYGCSPSATGQNDPSLR
jgi:hypothetical protein